jgi:hypothetical protein
MFTPSNFQETKRGLQYPFRPPVSEVQHDVFPERERHAIQEPFAGFDIEYAGKQTRIVPPEKETAAYELVHLVAGTKVAGTTGSLKSA